MGPSRCDNLEKVERYGSVLWINESGRCDSAELQHIKR